MAVQFSGALTRASTIQNVLTQLHASLTAAGWEIVYANADAIGTGTASSPAWSKTPAVSTSAGLVIYRMPLVTGFPTRWCVQIEALWTSGGTGYQQFRFTQGTDATAGGALTNPGSIQALQANGPNNASTEWYVSTYEHGAFLTIKASSGGVLWGMERRRRLDGTLLDDLSVYVATASSSVAHATIGSTGVPNGGSMTHSITTGETVPQNWVVYTDSAGNTPYTLNRMDGATGVPCGPINVSGGTAGMPRLFAFLPTNDAVVGVDNSMFADGQTRAYHVADAANILTSSVRHPRLAIAKE